MGYIKRKLDLELTEPEKRALPALAAPVEAEAETEATDTPAPPTKKK
ncbi:unnamed protein product [Gemmata massiliana]|uniref:Uncharacterized protein n=1 Tax=Gemmata massiliana TaxID=1210884 RepID=A0A6P2DES4_9BACT|nr:unnamed protein product [Gemmata massiliana]